MLVTVGGIKITEADLQAASADLGQQFAQLPPPQRRLATLAALIDIKALATKAEAEKLGDDAETARRIAFLRERALHNAYFEKHGIAAITDAEVRARYDKEVAAIKPVEEVHAKHILVPTKEEAEAVVKELDAGKDFDALAAEKSSGPTGPQGGDLGFFGPGQMVPAFETAAYALQPGTYTKEPIQTQFGWHVIKVLEKRPQQPPAFEQVADQVRQVVMREKYVELVQAARADEAVTTTTRRSRRRWTRWRRRWPAAPPRIRRRPPTRPRPRRLRPPRPRPRSKHAPRGTTEQGRRSRSGALFSWPSGCLANVACRSGARGAQEAQPKPLP